MAGKVYLVGAGPGDPELLTLKGQRALREADVVIYDRLANPRFLDYASEAAEWIYAGKEAQRHALTQEEINALLVDRARAGKIVCRLKGGDPFIFGRGGEEAEVLTASGLEWEYVPGISSAIAAPGYAGIPVTHRGLCSAFTIVTAHEDPLKEESSIRWEHLAAGGDTLVFLMGAERLPQIVERLIAHGRPPSTPAAVVSWGTYPRQRCASGTLADIVERCAEAGCGPPAVTLVGEVAALRDQLRWFDNRPLFGKRIVVTRPVDQAPELVRRIEERGGEAITCPTIRIQPLPNPDLSGLQHGYHWVVFTSVNGVYSLLQALRNTRRDLRALGSARIAAIGPETARAVEAAGLFVDFVPSKFVAEQVVEEFPEPVTGKRVLLPRAREARELLPELWRARGATVDVVPVYATVPETNSAVLLRDELTNGRIDAITFTASSTVRNFVELMPPGLWAANKERVRIACIGPITAATAREMGLRVDVVADRYTTAGLVEALEAHYGSAGK